FIQSVGSVAELLQYPGDTRLQIQGVDDVLVEGVLAERLGVTSGDTWARLSGIREVGSTRQPICWTDVYVLPEYASVAQRIGEPQPVYALIEAQFGEQVAHVDIEIQAQLLAPDVAERLGVGADSPTLTVVRRYLGRSGRIFEVSVAQHPADRFSYRLSLSRDRLNPQESP
ncbi:MAG: UTRA domain-containing protein, partial [Pseudomonadota bacterium]